jgi:3-phosphoshikimate 1-carboxyvinyltransferase
MNTIISPQKKLADVITVPGDKSVTHRSIIVASLATGQSIVNNYLRGDDCLRTITMFKDMGIDISENKDALIINGIGIDGLRQPGKTLYAGNSGTTIRLMSGVIAGQTVSVEITGDESLSKRPMKRIIEPLQQMGVNITGTNGQYAPLKIVGNPSLNPITYELPVPSAQVKSCILFAGMQASGTTTIIEPTLTRDHTERMLEYFGIPIKRDRNKIIISGPVKNYPSKPINVPGDFSSAAFFIVGGCICSNNLLKIMNVGINPTRTGLMNVLKQMGADITIERTDMVNNEPTGDLVIKRSKLKCINLSDPYLVSSMIDEIPVLCLAATQAEGRSIITGAKELRVKESDRIRTITDELTKLGAKISELEDGFIIDGPTKLKGSSVESHDDHRIAMTLAIAGLIADGQTTIQNSECVNISFPKFWDYLS